VPDLEDKSVKMSQSLLVCHILVGNVATYCDRPQVHMYPYCLAFQYLSDEALFVFVDERPPFLCINK
jgi:hypothetical protein